MTKYTAEQVNHIMEQLMEDLKRENIEIALEDARGELDYNDYYLDIDEDGEMGWMPGYKTDAICYYSHDNELQDMSESEVIDWIEDCTNASEDEIYQKIYEYCKCYFDYFE